MRIQIDKVTKAFGRFVALDGVSIDVPPGRIVAVLGPNGAGKTTLLRCLGGLLLPDKGQILCDEEALRRDRLDLRRRMAFLPDLPPLYGDMTVIQHLGMVLRLYGTPLDGIEDRVVEVLKELDLLVLAEIPISHLSRGQAYKTALAGVLAADPEVWLIDEPFASGMDPHGITSFKTKARAHRDLGGTLVYTTQILDIAERFSDLVCIIHRGEVRAFDGIEQLRTQGAAEGGVLESIFRQLREDGA